MAIVAPFRGTHYASVRELSRLLAPPFDVIGAAEHGRLCRMHRHNVIHLTLGSSTSRRSYDEIGKRLLRWARDGVLAQDNSPCFYAYCQEYERGGHTYKFWGLLSLLKLEPIGTGHIFPHEAVMPAPVDDRYRIMEHTRSNLEPIMTLYRQPSDPMDLLYESLESVPPLLSVSFPGRNRHRIWPLSHARTQRRIRRMLKRRRLFVADGHHRYHAAWMFRQRHRRLAGAQWMMSLLGNTEQHGLRIEPIHRTVLSPGPVPADLALSLQRFGRVERLGRKPGPQVMNPGRNSFGCYSKSAGAILVHLPPSPPGTRPRDRLEVVRVHDLLPQVMKIKDYVFVKDPRESILAARRSAAYLACFLPAIPSQHICSIAFGGETLPQKSTFFIPKPLSGLILRRI